MKTPWELGHMKIKINHPMADTMSRVNFKGTYSGEGTSELAFFRNNDWQVIAIPEFAIYHDGSSSNADTAVYPWVPNEVIDEFLNKYRA